jgi:Fe-S cluster assembly protein SufB
LAAPQKGEPEFMLEWRFKAYRHWLTMTEPHWPNVHYPPIDYQSYIYYAAPKPKKNLGSLDEVDPEVRAKCSRNSAFPWTNKSASPAWPWMPSWTAFPSRRLSRRNWAKGDYFLLLQRGGQEIIPSWSEISGHGRARERQLFCRLNSAVFSDGSFCYIPKGVRCPMELSTYFRINTAGAGQFERTLIIADEGSYVSYLEGCTAPMRDTNQLHAAVVELIALDDASIKYSTVQNWYPGDKEGKGGIYNFVTKRGKCAGAIQKFPGRRSKPARPSPGNIPACC